MSVTDKTIGRLIAVLVDTGLVEREKAAWILAPSEDKAESEDNPALQDHKIQHMLDELSNMSPMTITAVYLYAKNIELYGVDVTQKWLTATQNASALSRAYEKGYYEGLKRQAESEKSGYERACKNWKEKIDAIKTEIENRSYGIANDSVIQGEMYERQAVLRIIDKHTGTEED